MDQVFPTQQYFNLAQSRSSDEAMESLGQGIQALTSLSNLKLTFNSLMISDEGLLNFGQGLGDLVALKNIDLHFNQ